MPGAAIPPSPSWADEFPPPGLGLFRLYVGTAMWLNVVAALVIGGLFFFRGEEFGFAARERFLFGTAGVIAGAGGAVVHGVALREVRRPWYWWYGAALIGLGLGSLCGAPIILPLFLSWLKPRTRAWFGVSAVVPDDV